MSLHIDQIRIDGGTQSRAAINEATVAEYAEAMADPDTVFPPVIVYHDGKEYWLADGFHRLAAWRAIGRTEIPSEVRQGDRRRAILHSVAANSVHGLRRTNEDKRRAVLTLLEDEEWSRWSDREIARRCAVHHEMVGKLRAALTGGSSSDDRTYTTKHGTETVMNTANIGARSKPDQQSTAPDPQKMLDETADQQDQSTTPSKPDQDATHAAERRNLSGLTREALEDDLAGALAEIAALKGDLAKANARIADLERANAELAHSEHGRIIADLQGQRDREKAAKGKKMNELAVEARKLRQANARIADLERDLAASREREVIPL